VAIVFIIFGLYGLYANNKYRKFPFPKTVIFLIAGIYLLRGFEELVVDNMQGTDSITETIYSCFALAIGILFFIGGWQKWEITMYRLQ